MSEHLSEIKIDFSLSIEDREENLFSSTGHGFQPPRFDMLFTIQNAKKSILRGREGSGG